jgi:MFS family permease
MALLCPLPLIAAIGGPSWPLAAGLWLACGLCQGFMVPLMSTFMLLTPPELRGRLSGFAGATFAVVTAGTFLVCGALADSRTPQFAVAVAGALSLALVAATVTRWPRAELRRQAARVYARPMSSADGENA